MAQPDAIPEACANQMNHAFEDIEVKENAVEPLEDALRRKRKECMIGEKIHSSACLTCEKSAFVKEYFMI